SRIATRVQIRLPVRRRNVSRGAGKGGNPRRISVTFRSKAFIAASIFGGFFLATASATPITGILNISGGVVVSAGTIDFLPVVGGTTTADAFTNTGSFAVLNTGNPGAPATGTIL